MCCQGDWAEQAWSFVRKAILASTKCKKPSDAELQNFLKPLEGVRQQQHIDTNTTYKANTQATQHNTQQHNPTNTSLQIQLIPKQQHNPRLG